MNLKYYLRGLGIGILVTAIIMLVISRTQGTSMSDEEIKQRALALGMVDEGTVLSDFAEKNLENLENSNGTGDETDADASVNSSADLDMSGDAKASGDSNVNVDANANTDSESDLDSKANNEANANVEADSEIGANGSADNNEAKADNGTEANADNETKTDTVSGTDNASGTDATSDSSISLDEVEKVLDDADAYLEKKKTQDSGDSSQKSTENTQTTANSSKETATSKDTNSSKETAASKDTDSSKKTDSSKDNSSANSNGNTGEKSGNTKKLVISSGEGSYTVAKHLMELGLVKNANDFDTYLCNTGKDRTVHTGTYEIPEGSSEEEIARMIAG